MLPAPGPIHPADNVGDNVGDIAGMGADLFGSFAESTCAALVVSSGEHLLEVGWQPPAPLVQPAAGQRAACAGGALGGAACGLKPLFVSWPPPRPAAAVSSLGATHSWVAMCYPLLITGSGIIVCILTTLIATDFRPARVVSEIESTLKVQLVVSTLIMTPVSTAGCSCLFFLGFCWSGMVNGYRVYQVKCICAWRGVWG